MEGFNGQTNRYLEAIRSKDDCLVGGSVKVQVVSDDETGVQVIY